MKNCWILNIMCTACVLVGMIVGCKTIPRTVSNFDLGSPVNKNVLATAIGQYVEEDQNYWCGNLLGFVEITGPIAIITHSNGLVTASARYDGEQTTAKITFGCKQEPEGSIHGRFNRYEWQEGDEIYLWATPKKTWDELRGRSGAAHIRGRRLLDAVLWRLN